MEKSNFGRRIDSELYDVCIDDVSYSGVREGISINAKNLNIYRDFLAEIDEVNKHKWIESEKAGYDIGWEMALVDWMVHYRAGWLRDRKTQAKNRYNLRKNGRQ